MGEERKNLLKMEEVFSTSALVEPESAEKAIPVRCRRGDRLPF